MQKVAALVSTILALFVPMAVAYAAGPSSIPISIGTPAQGVDPNLPVGQLLSNVLTMIFVVAALAVLFMLVWGAFSWITSGGDKDAIAAARKRIINALIGLAVLALAFFITRVVGQIVGINVTDLKYLPTLTNQCPANQVPDPTNPNGCVPSGSLNSGSLAPSGR